VTSHLNVFVFFCQTIIVEVCEIYSIMSAIGLKRRKSYDLKYKLDAVEYAEMNSNEKAAKMFQVSCHIPGRLQV
jgi:hypothetical protein